MENLVRRKKADEMFGNFYYSTFKNGGICAFDIRYISPLEALKAIKNSGGLAVLAHSGQQQNFSLIPELVKNGLDGLELNHHSHSPKDRETIREYAEKYSLFLKMCIRDRAYSEQEKERAFSILDELGLADQAYKRCDELSGGQKQRVGIARSIMQDPKLILCDEPIASLDPRASKVIMDHLQKINRERKITCIVNLHQVCLLYTSCRLCLSDISLQKMRVKHTLHFRQYHRIRTPPYCTISNISFQS